jgi:hypothetical protein
MTHRKIDDDKLHDLALVLDDHVMMQLEFEAALWNCAPEEIAAGKLKKLIIAEQKQQYEDALQEQMQEEYGELWTCDTKQRAN